MPPMAPARSHPRPSFRLSSERSGCHPIWDWRWIIRLTTLSVTQFSGAALSGGHPVAKRSKAMRKFEERKSQQSREATISAFAEAAQDFVVGVAGHLDPAVSVGSLTIRAILKFAGT